MSNPTLWPKVNLGQLFVCRCKLQGNRSSWCAGQAFSGHKNSWPFHLFSKLDVIASHSILPHTFYQKCTFSMKFCLKRFRTFSQVNTDKMTMRKHKHEVKKIRRRTSLRAQVIRAVFVCLSYLRFKRVFYQVSFRFLHWTPQSSFQSRTELCSRRLWRWCGKNLRVCWRDVTGPHYTLIWYWSDIQSSPNLAAGLGVVISIKLQSELESCASQWQKHEDCTWQTGDFRNGATFRRNWIWCNMDLGGCYWSTGGFPEIELGCPFYCWFNQCSHHYSSQTFSINHKHRHNLVNMSCSSLKTSTVAQSWHWGNGSETRTHIPEHD